MRVMDRLHEAGTRTVVLSSTDLGSDQTLVGLASIRDSKFQPTDPDNREAVNEAQ